MTDDTTVCEHCFGTGQKVEMRPVSLGASPPPRPVPKLIRKAPGCSALWPWRRTDTFGLSVKWTLLLSWKRQSAFRRNIPARKKSLNVCGCGPKISKLNKVLYRSTPQRPDFSSRPTIYCRYSIKHRRCSRPPSLSLMRGIGGISNCTASTRWPLKLLPQNGRWPDSRPAQKRSSAPGHSARQLSKSSTTNMSPPRRRLIVAPSAPDTPS